MTPHPNDPSGIELIEALEARAQPLTDPRQREELYEVKARLLELYLRTDDRDKVASTLLHLGVIAAEMDRADEARSRFSHARALFIELERYLDAAECTYDLLLLEVRAENSAAARQHGEVAINAYTWIINNRTEQVYPAVLGVARCEFLMGAVEGEEKNHDAARERLTRAGAIFTDLGQTQSAADCEWALAEIAVALGEQQRAAELSLRSLEACDPLEVTPRRAQRSLTAADVLQRLGSLNDAEQHAEEARTIFRLLGDNDGVGDCELTLGDIYFSRGDLESAEATFHSGLGRAFSSGEHKTVAEFRMRLGNVFHARNQYARALDEYKVAFETFDAHLDEAKMALITLYVGQTQRRLGNLRTAITLYESASSDFRRLRRVDHLGVGLAALGNALIDLTHFDRAQAVLEEARELVAEAGLTRDEAECALTLGFIAFNKGEPHRSRELTQAALTIFSSLGIALSTAECHRLLGAVAFAEKDYLQAVEEFTTARQIYSSQGAHAAAATCTTDLARIALELRSYNLAHTRFASAQRTFSSLHLDTEVAFCEIGKARASALESLHTGAVTNERELRDATESATAAHVYLDSLRFQFPSAADRIAWSRRVEDSSALLFWIAELLHDERLISDLIETMINSGVHAVSTSSGSLGSDGGPLDLRSDYCDDITDAAPGETDASSLGWSLGGPGRLVAGAHLPMQPPPRIVMPDLHLALSPWRERSAHVFPRVGADSMKLTIR
ncbi:MAG TPA: tetratricopeptide repeat protein [Dietzia sp.]|nr:tetratricopeptide repeat protein [Dietzia sp.]